jgi:hypothetical protein
MDMMEMLKGVVSQECCEHHCRDWRETRKMKGLELTASNHSPSCPNYREEVFYAAHVNGRIVVCESVKQLKDLEKEAEHSIGVSLINLTRDQYYRLKEIDAY